MGTGSTAPEQQAMLTRLALEEAGLNVPQVWMHYSGLSGDAGEFEVDAYLNGLLVLPALQRDLVSLSVNELIDGSPGARSAPYSDAWREGQGQDGSGDG